MKIEIDLDDIFRDDEGNPEESLQDSIRRQVITKLEGDLRKRLFERMDLELAGILRESMEAAVSQKVPGLIDDLMVATYRPCDRYGSLSEPTTFRNELLKTVMEQLTYKPDSHTYRENVFTKAVREIVEKQTREMKSALEDQINEQFKRDALTYAVETLSKRLGLPKTK